MRAVHRVQSAPSRAEREPALRPPRVAPAPERPRAGAPLPVERRPPRARRELQARPVRDARRPECSSRTALQLPAVRPQPAVRVLPAVVQWLPAVPALVLAAAPVPLPAAGRRPVAREEPRPAAVQPRRDARVLQRICDCRTPSAAGRAMSCPPAARSSVVTGTAPAGFAARVYGRGAATAAGLPALTVARLRRSWPATCACCCCVGVIGLCGARAAVISAGVGVAGTPCGPPL